jgi:S1-C subfamily serine protease
MYISSRGLVRVFWILSFVLSSFALGQNFYVLEAQAALSSVRIDTPTEFGMGVALEDGATIATCAHVVDNNNWVDIDTGEVKEKGYVIAVDTENDIAIIRLESKIRPFIPRHCRDRVAPGKFVLAAGKPNKCSEIDMRPGSAITYFDDAWPDLIISSEPKPGYSGGPVMDENGCLIGIMKSFATVGDKTGTAVIPAWKILEFIQKTRASMQK